MQLVIQLDAPVDGGSADIVIASHDDGLDVPQSAYPGCYVAPWAGRVEELDRIGPAPSNPTVDTRPIRAPAIDMEKYAAAVRYGREQGTITVKIGRSKVPLSVARDNRPELRGKLQDIGLGIRQDGDVFRFADGVSRAVSNADMETIAKQALVYVQALYNREAEIKPQLGTTYRTMPEVDAAFDAVKP